MPRCIRLAWFSALCIVFSSSPLLAAGAPCSWSSGFHIRGLDESARASVVFDDGSGPALYVGGRFLTADDAVVHHIAKWDGNTWSPVGDGLEGDVHDLAVFDDGRGRMLVATGRGSRADRDRPFLTAWDGGAWTPMAGELSGTIHALAAFDDGSGPALYIGGYFTTVDGQAIRHIARWNRSVWQPVGEELTTTVYALNVVDLGDGPELFAGGRRPDSNNAATHVARWDGEAWQGIARDLDGWVYALGAFDEGDGARLWAGGSFPGGVATLDGDTWTNRGDAANGTFDDFAIYDRGDGPALYAGGHFRTADEVTLGRVGRWTGVDWEILVDGPSLPIRTLTTFDDGTGSRLFAGGWFTRTGPTPTQHIASWDGYGWSPVTRSTDRGSGLNRDVEALTVFDDGDGPALYAAGRFDTAGDQPMPFVGRWDGDTWTPLATGLGGTTTALTVFDDGNGKALYVGGRFRTIDDEAVLRVAKWNGSTWSALGAGLGDADSLVEIVYDLVVFDEGSGPTLFAAGRFDVSGGSPVVGVARWDGAVWSPVGSGLISNGIRALAVFDDGSGRALYAGGRFVIPGEDDEHLVAKWDGTAWTSIRSVGVYGGFVTTFEVFDDGSGPALFAGGSFRWQADGTDVYDVARWDGTTWSRLGTGTDGLVYDLIGFDDGSGRALYAAGSFTAAGGPDRHNIARWDGSAWSPLGLGLSQSAKALAIFDDGGGPTLYVGGLLSTAGGRASAGLAEYVCRAPKFRDDFESGDTSRWQVTVN